MLAIPKIIRELHVVMYLPEKNIVFFLQQIRKKSIINLLGGHHMINEIYIDNFYKNKKSLIIKL